MEKEHQKLVSRMIASAEGGGLLHKITNQHPGEDGCVCWKRWSETQNPGRDLRNKGKTGRSTGSATRRCKIWRTRHGGMRSSEVLRKDYQD